MSLPSVSIVVPVYNEMENINRLLECLRNQVYNNELEIILCDNGSLDGTLTFLKKQKGIILVHADKFKSPYFARNEGIKIASGDIIALTDANKFPEKDWIQQGVQKLLNEKVDLIGGRVNFKQVDSRVGFLYDRYTYLRNKRTIENNQTCTASNIFFKKEVWETTGEFPEYLRSGGDILWTYKATNNEGFAMGYASQSVVNYEARSIREVLRKDFRVGKGQPRVWNEMGYSWGQKMKNIVKHFFPPYTPNNLAKYLNYLKNERLTVKIGFLVIIYLGNLQRNFGRIKALAKENDRTAGSF